MGFRGLFKFGCPTGIRTPIDGTRNRSPTIRRSSMILKKLLKSPLGD